MPWKRRLETTAGGSDEIEEIKGIDKKGGALGNTESGDVSNYTTKSLSVPRLYQTM